VKFSIELSGRDSYGRTASDYVAFDEMALMISRVESHVCAKKIWPYISATTEVGKKHILAVDCDSIGEMAAARHWLLRKKIQTYPIQSSSEKFWLIGDMTGSFKKVMAQLERTPGADRQYVSLAKMRQALHLRAFSTIERPISFIDNDEEEFNNITNSDARKWILEFKAWFKSDEYDLLSTLHKITNGLANGTIGQVVANPSFVV